jgi:hypothetical protein
VRPSVPLRTALGDPQLLGSVLAGDSWRSWRCLMIAAMGEALTDDERAIFTCLTGRAREPLQRVEELAAVVGRRGGKSRAMATLAAAIISSVVRPAYYCASRPISARPASCSATRKRRCSSRRSCAS